MRRLERRVARHEGVNRLDAPERRAVAPAERVRAEQAAFLTGGPDEDHLVREFRGIGLAYGEPQRGGAGAVVARSPRDARAGESHRLLPAGDRASGSHTVRHDSPGIEPEPGGETRGRAPRGRVPGAEDA